MRTSTVIGWAGLAAIAGGGLRVLGHLLGLALLFEPGFDPARFDLPAASVALGSLLVLVGLVGLHLREARAYGRLGTAGFLLTFAGTFAGATLALAQTLGRVSPAGAVIAVTIAAGVVGTLGLLLLGVATLSNGTLPLPWGALPLAIFAGEVLSVLLSFFPPLTPVAEALVGVCWVLLGYALLSGSEAGEDFGSRAAPQTGAAPTRRGGRSVLFRRAAATALGLAALLALGILAARGVTNALGLGCNPADREYFAQFPQYANHEPELRSDREWMGTCFARFRTGDPKEEVLDYYEGKLRGHGWEVHRGKSAVNGRRGDDYYRVEYEDYRVTGGHPVTVNIHA